MGKEGREVLLKVLVMIRRAINWSKDGRSWSRVFTAVNFRHT